jgi:hypothetical protein
MHVISSTKSQDTPQKGSTERHYNFKYNLNLRSFSPRIQLFFKPQEQLDGLSGTKDSAWTAKFSRKMLYAVIFFCKHAEELHIIILKNKRVGNPYKHTLTNTSVTQIISIHWLQNISDLNLGSCCYLITEKT